MTAYLVGDLIFLGSSENGEAWRFLLCQAVFIVITDLKYNLNKPKCPLSTGN